MKTPSKKLVLLCLTLLVGAAVSHAAAINLIGNDSTVGTSSFNTGLNWAGGAVPGAGNDYNTAGFFMRTPGNTTTAYVFGGDSLTLGVVNAANGSMLEKFSSGAGSVRTLTINNFTNL